VVPKAIRSEPQADQVPGDGYLGALRLRGAKGEVIPTEQGKAVSPEGARGPRRTQGAHSWAGAQPGRSPGVLSTDGARRHGSIDLQRAASGLQDAELKVYAAPDEKTEAEMIIDHAVYLDVAPRSGKAEGTSKYVLLADRS
jgi:hypothetical protein